MKTKIKPDFSVRGNDQLTGKLKQLIHEFQLSYIFYHPANAKVAAHIVIIAEESSDIEHIQSRKWIRNNKDENPILFHIIGQAKMSFERRAGNPFFAWYCQKSAVIYQNPTAKECHDTDWLSFKKRFIRYSVAYSHDRDTLLTTVNRFQELGSLTGLFVSYLKVFEYTIQHLEMLFTGSCFESENLNQRIKQLTCYIQRMEGIFVQKNGNKYYLISELEKAKEVAEDGDEIRLNDKLIESFSLTETKLHKMVLSRLSEFKSLIKSGFPKLPIIDHEESTSRDDQVTEIAAQIVKIQTVEEIYLFHQIQNSQHTTCFLLLIGEGLGTEILNRIQQSVNSRFEGKYSVVLIGHSRSWIQTNLFYQQSFFTKIMKPENLRFQSHSNHPSIHWEHNHTHEYPDLEYLTRSAINLSAQYSVLRNHSEKDNTEGTIDLFSKSILRIFRTLVYSKLSYLPNYLPAFNLWKLCIYAEPRLEKLEYLFEKLSGEDFFKEVAYHSRFHHNLSRLTEKKLQIMDETLDALLHELKTIGDEIKETNDEVT
ncbi:MAG: hypothetical protein A2W90_21540 [Bacteroidetes bacterium GWF2_42_66]|nr:MAG: hypothetical protein A2W92_04355 [Bacteroidetes bacterium GWA2_42_15]OFX98917.1 MAG: hypothetical protein A2W89_13175 [Bacteroidetes bacterium GWE2_42_39]OFY45632.1 MAG: hypothetical protein A2W90_21540 [Bacteroidetes bacterium GWF2_42_66]HBL77387.1 hypothetical protein [Prolixibacteraceae bacterium]HCU62545.1 hypothetical protein [Prolixibacteraceae bacterium]